ncbi:hypothetical protein BD779DRAFT_977565 [Infundibulicybe gibba]|nr:hypothetical protein BD779DRAFT_977565 [Infundibulicybe gibba]
MPLKDLSLLASAVLDLIQPGTLSDGALFKLQCVIPEKLLTSALDLIDRENVVKLTTPWGRTEYQILGSAAIHTVILEPRNNYMPSYCSCSAFAHLVLEPDPHSMGSVNMF